MKTALSPIPPQSAAPTEYSIMRGPGWIAFLSLRPAIARERTAHYIGRLEHALTDSHKLNCAYETLATFGEMERTANGYASLDPDTIQRRCRRLIAQLRRVQPMDAAAEYSMLQDEARGIEQD